MKGGYEPEEYLGDSSGPVEATEIPLALDTSLARSIQGAMERALAAPIVLPPELDEPSERGFSVDWGKIWSTPLPPAPIRMEDVKLTSLGGNDGEDTEE